MPAQRVSRFLGIIKAYTTRVGEGPFPTELLDATGDLIRNTGREFGTVTGRPRRCGWFDAVLARYSARVCGVTGVAVMLLDVLSELDEIKICIEYEHEGRRLATVPASADVLGECKPVYITKPGWKCDISRAKSLADLPNQARDYLDTISQLLGCPIDVVSMTCGRSRSPAAVYCRITSSASIGWKLAPAALANPAKLAFLKSMMPRTRRWNDAGRNRSPMRMP